MGNLADIWKRKNLFFYLVVFAYIFFVVMCMLPQTRMGIIIFFEKFVLHRPVKNSIDKSIWLFNFFSTQLKYSLIAMLFLVASDLYVSYVKNVFINFLRTIATLCVFILHVSIFSNRDRTLFNNFWINLLKLPAWGGVWMFFILGGYLSGKGFVSGRYKMHEGGGVIKYYMKKLTNVFIPAYFFCLFCLVFVYVDKIPKGAGSFIRFLLFPFSAGRPHILFGANFNLDGIGALWYIFTLLPLYLLSPFICMIFNKFLKGKKNCIISIFVVFFICGMLYRVFAMKRGLNWYNKIYIPFYANLDLYAGGILIAYLADACKFHVSKYLKQLSLFSLLLFIMINAMTYDMYYIHQTIYPSIYLVIVSCCLFSFKDEDVKDSGRNIIEKSINYFSGISMGFYFFHSLILHTISPVFDNKNIQILHIHLIVVSFVFTFICAVAWKRIWKPK